MARYVIANRRAGKFSESEKTAARAEVGAALATMSAGISIANNFEPDDPTSRRVTVFDADPAEVHAMRSRMASEDVIIEPEVFYQKCVFPLGYQSRNTSTSANGLPVGTGNTIKFHVTSDGNDLANAKVTVFYSGFADLSTSETKLTDANGKVSFSHANFWTPVSSLVEPEGDAWTMVHDAPAANNTVDCVPIDFDGPLAWWHETAGVAAHLGNRGNGIKVGVCDTGVGPHFALRDVTDVGAFINNAHLPGQGADVDAHGSHVCGIIGAKPPANSGEFAGVSPGVDLMSARVFAGPDSGASNADIANAIEDLSRIHQADLINLSLGGPFPSDILKDAIQDARERGTLCICAAGNSAGSVEFPGAFSNSVAVAALGKLGTAPNGSLSSFRKPQDNTKFGNENLFLANFSCFGSEITCAAPGVGYISTVPERGATQRPYLAFDGTSMASPLVAGVLAAKLSESNTYLNSNRDLTRSSIALQILEDSCRSIGLSFDFQGHGVPSV